MIYLKKVKFVYTYQEPNQLTLNTSNFEGTKTEFDYAYKLKKDVNT